MSIGEDLAQARCRAGLSVTEVSQRTRIRQTIICGIEHDDYSACGGDFYARGHIRAIARAVGADPGPLIGEYDAAHPTPQAVMAADLSRPPAGPAGHWRRHRRAWAVVLGLVLAAALGFAAYHAVMGAHRAPGAPAGVAAGLHRHVTPPTAPGAYARKVVVHLRAVEDCWVEFTTPGGGYLFQSYVSHGTAKRWVFRHAVDVRLGNPGGITLRVDGKNPLPPGTVEPITLRLRRHGKVAG